MSGSIGGFTFFRLDTTGGIHVPPDIYSQIPEIIERPGLDGQDIRLTGERGAQFQMNSLAIVSTPAEGADLLAQYKQSKPGQYPLTWNGINYSTKQTEFVVIDVVPAGNDPGANTVQAGAFLGNTWQVRAVWTLLPVRPA